ncbi:hypothetical protein ACHAWU_008982 [Discostella pseudostelligera]|uniref:MICOS complex subunit MIC12 n=1 Tax=Discostella pseudostelligera TaxID=259834 RepID=A0ABD3MGV7_9STRA
MVFHLPSALVGSALAGCGFLLIHRELSHRRRLTTKWVVQEYAEEQWKEWRKQVADDAISESAKKNISQLDMNVSSKKITSEWNKGVAVLREWISEKKE